MISLAHVCLSYVCGSIGEAREPVCAHGTRPGICPTISLLPLHLVSRASDKALTLTERYSLLDRLLKSRKADGKAGLVDSVVDLLARGPFD